MIRPKQRRRSLGSPRVRRTHRPHHRALSRPFSHGTRLLRSSIRRLNSSLRQAQAHLALARHRFPNQQARLRRYNRTVNRRPPHPHHSRSLPRVQINIQPPRRNWSTLPSPPQFRLTGPWTLTAPDQLRPRHRLRRNTLDVPPYPHHRHKIIAKASRHGCSTNRRFHRFGSPRRLHPWKPDLETPHFFRRLRLNRQGTAVHRWFPCRHRHPQFPSLGTGKSQRQKTRRIHHSFRTWDSVWV